jgi:hypothetical protein
VTSEAVVKQELQLCGNRVLIWHDPSSTGL